MTLLSILIPSMTTRATQLESLWREIDKQTAECGVVDQIEILTEIDDGSTPTGTKRQRLLERAKGLYSVFIDDDDLISSNYIKEVTKALGSRPDCVGFKYRVTTPQGQTRIAIASLENEGWMTVAGITMWSIMHTSPVLTKLALQAGFPDTWYREDFIYSDKLKPLLKSQVFIDQILYFYQRSSENHKKIYEEKDLAYHGRNVHAPQPSQP